MSLPLTQDISGLIAGDCRRFQSGMNMSNQGRNMINRGYSSADYHTDLVLLPPVNDLMVICLRPIKARTSSMV